MLLCLPGMLAVCAASRSASAGHAHFSLASGASTRLVRAAAAAPVRMSAGVSSGVVPARLVSLAAELREAPDARARALALARLGASSELCADGSSLPPAGGQRVPGCTSVTYVAAAVDGEGVARLRGSSDAAISRGLLSLVVDGLDGSSAQEALRVTGASIRQLAALDGTVAPSRINGLDNILKSAHAQLTAALSALAPATGDAEAAPLLDLRLDKSLDAELRSTGVRVQSGGERAPSALEAATVPLPTHNQYWVAPSSSADSVALLLSGGVDSSVALHLLKEKGVPVRAFYLRVWLADELSALSDCPWEEDWAYCSAVADQLKVPLEAVSVQEEYRERVVNYLVEEARNGRTPNPDVMCNSRIKFGVFLDSVGANFQSVASGHYAQLRKVPVLGGKPGEVKTELIRATDRHKDQSYFLSSLTQGQLSRLSFPIGNIPKPDVRVIAEIGTHRGIWYHTNGQRKGIVPGLGPKFAAHGPWYVVGKDVGRDAVFVSRNYAQISDERLTMEVNSISWTGGAPCAPGESMRVGVQVRHGDGSSDATLELAADGTSGRVTLDCVDKGLAPGQFAAFYDGDVCLGAGAIS
ncbi:tRNA methyl transferase-domain-containing protein [Pavlovales sp. CCMP2436]|nr:tRNA methyl transferase-domain-containing protein [Pavlovales sp. CCMP2436]